ncbi:MAG TPA: hypothetical protein VEG84_01760 [Thermoanaerobaculia bacterium]|nr:hypothetical protein [Thermoanaerobaculia bacterium]
MSLSAGTKLGPYEIQSPVRAGGMGDRRSRFAWNLRRVRRTGRRLGRSASTAGLIPRLARAPAARASSLGYFGRLRAPRAEGRARRRTDMGA